MSRTPCRLMSCRTACSASRLAWMSLRMAIMEEARGWSLMECPPPDYSLPEETTEYTEYTEKRHKKNTDGGEACPVLFFLLSCFRVFRVFRGLSYPSWSSPRSR